MKAGSSTDISLTSSDVGAWLPKFSDFAKIAIYTSPDVGEGTEVPTITVGSPSKIGAANQIHLGLTVPADIAAGTYELYENGNATGAKFQVTAGSTAPQAPASKPGASQTPIHVEPSTSPPGQVVNVKLTGGDIANQLKSATPDKLHLFWQLPGGHTDFSVMLPVTDAEFSAADPSETIQISIAPAAMSGTYQLYLDSQTTGTNTARTALDVQFIVGSSLGEYTVCPLVQFQGNETDLVCSQSLLTYKEAREVFGKAVADQYIAVEIKVQNRNEQYQFLLGDIRIGTSNSQLTTSRDRTFVRSYAEKGEAYSVRAIALRALDAATAILGGIGPAVGNAILSSSVQILAGPTTSAMHSLFPDRSSNEINVISDSGFSVVQALVIPAKSPIRVFCFVPQREVLDQPLSKISDDTSKWTFAKDFQTLQRELFVEISGMHVTQAKTGPTLSSLTPDNVPSGSKEPVSVALSGSNLDQVRSVQLGEDGKFRFSLEATSGNSSSGKISVTNLDAMVSSKGSGATLPVYLITTTGQQVQTSKQFSITAAAVGTPPVIKTASPPSGPEKTPVTITGTNFGSTQGTSTVTFNKTPATPASPKDWSDTSILVPVPAGAKTGSIVVTAGKLASKGFAFTVGTPPVIKTASPPSGPERTPVTITGTNFGSTQGTSTVTFNKTPATPTSWSDTSILVPVPAGAKTGSIVVTVGKLRSNGVSFIVP